MDIIRNLNQLYAAVYKATGSFKDIFRQSVYFVILSSVFTGLAYLCFIPIFYSIARGSSSGALWWSGALTILLFLTAGSSWMSMKYDYQGFAAKACDEARRELGRHLRRIPLQVLGSRRTGDFNAILSSSIDYSLNFSFTILYMMIHAILIPIVVGVGAFFFDWRLGLAILIIFPASLPVYAWFQPTLEEGKKRYMDAHKTLYSETVEYTQGLVVLKSAGCVEDKEDRFTNAVKKVEEVQFESMRREALPNILVGSIIEIGMLIVMAIGLWLVTNGDIQIMLLAGLLVAIIRFAEPMGMFISMMSAFELVKKGFDSIKDTYSIEPLPILEPIEIPKVFNVTFDNIGFRYKDQEDRALNGVSFEIKDKSFTALVGSSGCGKTTITKMITRYDDPEEGRVLIGGVDVRHIPQERLNQLVSTVFQDVYLFDDTVFANIQVGKKDATEEEVYEAARLANCHDFILELPDGYQTRVGDIGSNLSGGEKQRISIARAFLKNAPIVILDEPTAALDTRSECAVQSAIDELVKNRTVIVIAHRLSTIVAADNIVVVENGAVFEQGNHNALIAKGGRYSTLWKAQHEQLAAMEA